MTIRFTITAIAFCFGLTACLSPRTEEQDLLGVSEAIKTTPRYQQAKRFDAYLQNTLTPQERQAYLQDCRKSQEDIFCFSLAREKKLRGFLDRDEKASQTHLRQKPEAITPVIAGSKVKDWSRMQKANLKSLLSGMRAFSLEELKTVGAFAIKRKECPNNIAVSTAALLEMHLPFENLSNRIADLYEKGARCTRRRSPNQEHFLTRAALFLFLEKKYAAAEKLLQRVEPTDAFSGRSLYWLYRTRLKLGKADAAKKTLARLKNQLPLSFHSLMVQAEEKTDPIAASDNTTLPARSTINPSVNPIIEQAERLHEMAFLASASKMANWALTSYTPREPLVRAYISTLAEPPTQIRTLQTLLVTKPSMRNATFYRLAYPQTYLDLFREFSSQVDPFLLLSIARKESTMNPRAVSPANAQGLLQLNPDTAKRLSSATSLDLFDPRTNAELAARYLAELRETMKGQLPLMIASYNAGEATVATWTQRYPTSDLLLFIDLIPYRETRDYVGFVLSNYFWYRRLYGEDAGATLASLTTGELAKVEEPRGVRSIKSSTADEAVKTSETWTDESISPVQPAGTPSPESTDANTD
jgi:soluble lytic murein transglycosylase